MHSIVFGGFAAASLAQRIDAAEPRVVMTASCGIEGAKGPLDYRPFVEGAVEQAKHKPEKVIIWQRDQKRWDPVEKNQGQRNWQRLVKSAKSRGLKVAEPVPVKSTDGVYVIYTSGTTGLPKGVFREAGGHAVQLNMSMKYLFGVRGPGDVIFTGSDIGWVVGHSYIVYAPLLAGATTILFEGKPIGTPNAGKFWQMVEDHKITTVFTAPTAMRAIRKDDTDDERTVARIFWETRVLSNDLVPILLETAGKGLVEDKRAVACADLMTAMTWPIDLAEELKELDEVEDKGTDYTQLLLSHLNYKAALLRPGVMEALFSIMLPCLAKDTKERKERDVQIINVILYLIRNLAFIKDLPANTHLSADQAEYSSLQSRLIKVLSDTHVLDLLLTIASNTSSNPLFNNWNVLTLEIIYLLFRGVKPSSLAADQAKVCRFSCGAILKISDYIYMVSNLRKTFTVFLPWRTLAGGIMHVTHLRGIRALGLPSLFH